MPRRAHITRHARMQRSARAIITRRAPHASISCAHPTRAFHAPPHAPPRPLLLRAVIFSSIRLRRAGVGHRRSCHAMPSLGACGAVGPEIRVEVLRLLVFELGLLFGAGTEFSAAFCPADGNVHVIHSPHGSS